eukprot:c32702_g1_i1 orf=130-318(+)
MGEKELLGLMKDVLGQFYLKRKTQPPLLSLCCFVPHEVVRFAADDTTWLVPSFDTTANTEIM